MIAAASLVLLLPSALPQEPETAPDPRLQALEASVRRILPRIEELRGWKYREPVAVGIQTREEFRESARRMFEKEIGGAEHFRKVQESWRLAGLIPDGLDLYEAILGLLEAAVGGFYDPDTRTFYMIEGLEEGAMADIIMAHELTHALDDQYFGLRSLQEPVKRWTDPSFGVSAVIEGSATAVMNQYLLEGPSRGWLQMGEEDLEKMLEEQEAQLTLLEEYPPWLILSLNLPYIAGNAFLVRTDQALLAASRVPSEEDLRGAFAAPPLSSEQVLHPSLYWEKDRRDDPVDVRLPDFSASLGEDWSLLHEDVLGELACAVLTNEALQDGEPPDITGASGFTTPAAAGWDGDRIQVYRRVDGARVGVWALVWDTARDREEFATAVEEILWLSNPFLREWSQAEDVVVLYLADAAGKEALPALRRAVEDSRPGWR